ncbi:MAG: hypothetical protein JWQ63_2451 [Mucilaginibacter sp.]|nr:hypothetical protein [Mucilaginibacter sp.]
MTIQERITEFNKDRLPDMVKLKYKAMSLGPFRFFRGTCHLFYEDLFAADPLLPSPLSWICGDLHLENFGCFKGDNRQEYFDLNDFDEALMAPAAWELARIVTSILVAFDSLKINEDEALKMARKFLKIYSLTLIKGKAVSIDHRTATGIVGSFLTTVEKRKQKDLLKKLIVKIKGKLTLLLDNDRHFELAKPLKKELSHFIDDFIKTGNYGAYNFKVLDSTFRLAGTGSIGVKRYLFLLKSLSAKNKYMFLDMKQAAPSSLKPYINIQQPQWGSEAERVIAIQKRMQNVSPALLSATIFNREAYVIKQMQPTEDKITFELLRDRYKDIDCVIEDMAVLTASAQLRSSGRQGSSVADELIAYGQNNQWQETILKYAHQYATQVKKDYKEFVTGNKKGSFN